MSCQRAALFLAGALALPAHLAGQAVPLSEVFVVSAPEMSRTDVRADQGVPVAAALPHDFAVASLRYTVRRESAVDGRLVDLSGQPGPAFVGEILGDGADPFFKPPVIAAAGRGFVLAWAEWPFSVRYRRFGPGGVPATPHAEGIDVDRGDSLAVAGNASGGFVLAWTVGFPDDPTPLFVRGFSAAGAPVTQELRPAEGEIGLPRVGMDAAGRFAVLWRKGGTSAPAQLCGQAYGVRGGFLGAGFCVGALADATGGALAVDPEGSFLAAWFGPAAANGASPLFVRRYAMNGTPQGSAVQVASAVSPSQLEASADRRGNAALSWRQGDRLLVLPVRRDAVAQGPPITISGLPDRPAADGVALADSGRLLVTWRGIDESLYGRLWQVPR